VDKDWAACVVATVAHREKFFRELDVQRFRQRLLGEDRCTCSPDRPHICLHCQREVISRREWAKASMP